MKKTWSTFRKTMMVLIVTIFPMGEIILLNHLLEGWVYEWRRRRVPTPPVSM